MKSVRKRKKTPVKGTIIVIAVVVLLGLIFFITSGGKIYRSSRKNQDEINQNKQLLKELSSKSPGDYSNYTPPAELNLSEIQEELLSASSDSFDEDKIRIWYQDAVILGDSISVAAAEYGYLGYDVICAKIGAGPLSADDLFADAISRNPKVLFVVLGSNDISNYAGDPSLFMEQYSAVAERLKEALPDTAIFMHAILPVQEGVAYEEGMEFRSAYNEALETYCSNTPGVYYVNADFILQNDPELYDVDGIHPKASFYPRWLTYLAEVAGLSEDQ